MIRAAGALLVLAAATAAADTSPRLPGFQPSRLGLLRTTVPRNGALYDCCFSPDGRWLAVAGARDRVRLVSVKTWKSVRPIGPEGTSVYSCAFSPDGKTLAMLDAGGQARLYEVDEGRERWACPAATGQANRVRFTPDGRRVVIPAPEGGGLAVDPANGRGDTRFGPAGDPAFDFAFSRDGRRLFMSTLSGRLSTVDVAAWKETRWWTSQLAGTSPVALSPDGRTAASGHADAGIRLWETETGAELRTLKGHTGMVFSLVFTADGRHLASGGGLEAKLWETRGWTQVASLMRHRSSVRACAFSPNGLWMATVGLDQLLNVWGPSSTPGTIRPRAFLGVGLRGNGNNACELNEVRPGGAAERAGLKVGDQLLEIDGEPCSDYGEAVAMIGSHSEGDEVEFKLRRDEKEFTLKIRLGKRPDGE